MFIASNYTPWLYLRSTYSGFQDTMLILVWVGAFIGVIYQIVFHEQYKILEIIFYLIVGLCPSIVMMNMVSFCYYIFHLKTIYT